MNPDPQIITMAEIIIIAGVFLICAFLVAAQKAISDVNRNVIKSMAEEGNIKAIRLIKVFDKPLKILMVTFIVVTFLGILVSQIVAVNHLGIFYKMLIDNNIPFAGTLSIIILSLISALIFIVIAIFLPRQIAKQHTEGVALRLAGYANALIVISTPFAIITRSLTNILLKIFRQKTWSYEDDFSEDYVISMLEKGQETGALKEEGKKMINSIFAFDDKLAYEIMTPRTEVFAIDVRDEPEKYLDELMEMKHSRIPVYDDDSDNIIGILNIKDYLIRAREDGFGKVEIKGILREPFYVPETKNIDSLFFELQHKKQHIAILIDEYGGFSGIVTMEDIIEEVMGDIDDEFDEEEQEIEKLDENKYLIDGYMNLDDINEKLKTSLESETSETVGGLIIDILGEIPDDSTEEKIVVSFENYDFEVVNVKDRRIEDIIMTINDNTKNGEDHLGE